MIVGELIESLDLEVVVGVNLDREIEGAYIGDLLSNVMARAKENNLWVTIQGHQNVVAVALLTNVSAVVVVEDFDIEDAAIERAKEKEVNILRTSKTAYEFVLELSELGA
ncbi:DRTGG domain-containing protein [Natronospora cellulosivora (SeqCode)]